MVRRWDCVTVYVVFGVTGDLFCCLGIMRCWICHIFLLNFCGGNQWLLSSYFPVFVFLHTQQCIYIFFSHVIWIKQEDVTVWSVWTGKCMVIFLFLFSMRAGLNFYFLLSIITFNLGNLSHRVFCKYLQWQVLLNNDLRLDSQRCIFQKKKKKKKMLGFVCFTKMCLWYLCIMDTLNTWIGQ